MGRDHFFLARATVPHHVKAASNRLESGGAFSAMSEGGVESGLMVAIEAINITGRTKTDAVKNPMCNTPKASSVSAGGVERVRYEVEKPIRTWRSWFEGASEDLDHSTVRGRQHTVTRDQTRRSRLRGCADDHVGSGARVRRGRSFQRYTERCGHVKTV